MKYVYVADAIQARRDKGEGPIVGPYKTGKENPDGSTYTVTTEVWELDVAEVILKFPKRWKQKADEAKLTDEQKADLAKLGRFRRAEARVLGKYLTMQRYALEVMAVEGLMPTIAKDKKASDFVRGTAHIRCKVVTSTTGSRTEYYLFVKIHPGQAAPTHRLAIFNRDPAFATANAAQVALWDAEQEKAELAYGVDSAHMAVALIPQKATKDGK